MNTKQDMFADFFQGHGFSNITGSNIGFIDKMIIQKMPFNSLAQRGTSDKNLSIHTDVYHNLRERYGINDSEMNMFFDEFKKQGGNFMDANAFKNYVASNLTTKDEVLASINQPKIDTITTDVSDVNFQQVPAPNKTSFLYIGLGVVAVVGITILLVRK
jgi:hypothetical protein